MNERPRPFEPPRCALAGCDRPGMLGEGVDLLRGRIGTWFCSAAHRDAVRQRRTRAAVAYAPSPPAQDRLL